MKIFRNSAIDGSPPDTQQGFGYVWESDTASRQEIRWPWPSAYRLRTKTEGYRVSDGKVFGHTTFQMESDGQQYVSSLYLSTPGTTDITVVDLVASGNEFTTDAQRRFIFNDSIVSVVERNKTYTVCDYSADLPAFRVGDAGAWVDSGVMSQGDTLLMQDNQGRTRLFGFYQVVEAQVHLFFSSPLDGSPLTVAEKIVTNAPPGDFTQDTPGLLTAGAVTAVWLKQNMPELSDVIVTPFLYLAKVEGYGMLLQSMGTSSFFVYPSSGGVSIQATEYNFASGETVVYLYTADDGGKVTDRDQLQAMMGSSMFAGSTSVYPESNLSPPVVPPFWRGFIKTFETI